jgi:hypothetical protein
MKKFLKIFLITLGVILLLMIITPFLFKKQIMNIVKEQINANVNAKVEFADFRLSLIRGFPDLYVSLDDLRVIGTGDFEQDTLLTFRRFSAKVDVMSVIRGDVIKVKSILLDAPTVNAIVLADGKPNWDIVKASTDTTVVVEDTTATGDFNISLRKFEIREANIRYTDLESNMSANLINLNFLLKGDMSKDFTKMQINTTIDGVDFVMDGVKLMNQVAFLFRSGIDADMANSVYTLTENEIALNELSMSLEGVVKMPGDDMDFDLSFSAAKTEFKTLLSMVPAIYMKDFESVRTDGELSLDMQVKGIYNDQVMPNVDLVLLVTNGRFKYPELPKSAEKIGIDLKVFWDGTQPDNSVIDLRRFYLELGGNPMDMTLLVETPISDLQFNGSMTGKLDFAGLNDVVPIEDVKMKGLLDANVELMGRMSSIENETYEDVKADGSMVLTGFELESPDFPQGLKIDKTVLNFSPRFLELVSFDARVGKSDMRMNGKLTNFIPYIFKDDTIRGQLAFASSLLDVNEFMSPSETVEETTTDTAALSIIEIPGNIDFRLSTAIDQINYDKLIIRDVYGVVIVKDSRAILDKLKMNLLEGSMGISGEYNTQDIKNPMVDFYMDIQNFDIPSTYTAFNTVEKLAPVAKHCTGKISASFSFTSFLDATMSPIMESVASRGMLSTRSIEISNSNSLVKIADALKNDKFRKLNLNDLKINFEVKNGRVYVEPFETNFGSTKMIVGGSQGIDQTLSYAVNMAIPRSEFGGAANSVLNSLTSSAASSGFQIQPGETVNVEALVKGTVSDPQVSINLKESLAQSTEALKEQLKEQVQEKVTEVKQEVTQRAREQADKLIRDAEVEAEKIRSAARSAADQVRKESDASSQKVLDEVAGRPKLLQEAAKKSAEKIRKEGYEKAAKLESEADAKASAVVNKAKAEADKIE